jgi:UDP-galactopyranose mutase
VEHPLSKQAILVVGAGLAGAVYARTLAERGHTVRVIDRRPHIAGNAYDEVTREGVRLHRYGPHLFHTNNRKVVDWLERFAILDDYQHKVQAQLEDGRCVPLPVNRSTLNAVFGAALQDEAAVRSFLAEQAEMRGEISNAADHLIANIGSRLTDLFFRPYTRKMWQLELEELDAAVVKRIPIRHDDEDRYFPNDAHQALPRNGYTAAFRRIFDHPNISVELETIFSHDMLDRHAHCFNSMPIDEFFGYDEGVLPYRSIRFHHQTKPDSYARGETAVVNFTDESPFTRETDWSRLPGHRVHETGLKTITLEEPCDYRDNDFERYYPVKTSDGRFDAIYRRYRRRAERLGNVNFIGRCGTYQYLDMHQVINQSLSGAQAWLAARDAPAEALAEAGRPA